MLRLPALPGKGDGRADEGNDHFDRMEQPGPSCPSDVPRAPGLHLLRDRSFASPGSQPGLSPAVSEGSAADGQTVRTICGLSINVDINVLADELNGAIGNPEVTTAHMATSEQSTDE